VTSADCSGLATGEITVVASGGTSPFLYEWNDVSSQTDAMATNLCAGTFQVTITDDNNCNSVADVIITEPTELTATATIINHVSCFGGSDGSASVTASGGTAPYSYQWSSGTTPLADQTGGLSVGQVDVTITDDNGCTVETSVTITEPTELIMSGTVTDENCDQSNGIIEITAGGVTVASNYTYIWSHDATLNASTGTGLAGGSYTITVTDDNGCETSQIFTVNNIAAGTAVISSSDDVSCYNFCDGTATVSYGGGPGPLDFVWNTSPAQTTATATGLCSGTYDLSVTDDNNCVVTTSVTISEPDSLTLSFNVAEPVCNGSSDGIVMADPAGGTEPYSYLWQNLNTTQSVIALPAGNYPVTVTDANGCQVSGDTSLLDPDPIILYIDTLNANCGLNDGAIDLHVENAAVPVTYDWAGPSGYNSTDEDITDLYAGNYCVTVEDVKGCTATSCWNIVDQSGPTASIVASQTIHVSCNGGNNGSATVDVTGGTAPYSYTWSDPNGQFTPTANNLTAGNYNVAVSDSNGCVSVVDVTITEPPALDILITSTNPNCYQSCDGSATANINGGVAPYSYEWTIVDDSTATANLLCDGNYSVMVTDANGCTISESVEITEPPFISVVTNVINTTCSGDCNGQITAIPSGGTGTFDYTWNDSNGQNTATVLGLCSGSYTVTVIDDNNCTQIATALVTSPDPVIASIDNYSNVSCNGACDAYMIIDVYGGTIPYTYGWANGSTDASVTDMCAGSYIATVTDAQGCVDTAFAYISEPPALNLSLNTENESCYNYCDGSIDAVVTGGTAPYNYLWSTLQSGITIENLCDSTYFLTVTDDHGCTVTANAEITGPTLLGVSLNSVDSAHCQQADGAATVQVSGGTPGYTYQWEDNSGNPVGNNSLGIYNVSSGPYYFTVTDNNGCDASMLVVVNDISGPVIESVIASDVSCYGGNDGSATVTVSGGTLPYTYIWNDPSSSNQTTANNLSSGNYTIQVIDGVMCQNSASVTINEPNELMTAVVSHTDPLCVGSCDGQAIAQAAAGTPPYSYLWNDPSGQTTAQASGLCGETYDLVVTDDHGCTASTSITLEDPASISVSSAIVDVSCYGGNNGSINLVVSGGTPVYNYTWLTPPSSGNAVAGNLPANSYNVIITDNNGCEQMETYVVDEPDPISITYDAVPAYCNSCNGVATIYPDGGTGNYSVIWSPSQDTTLHVENLCPGTHMVSVYDENSCVDNFSIQIFYTEPPVVSEIITSDVSCHGGSDGTSLIYLEHGTAPYEYHWDNMVAGLTDQMATDLEAGYYELTVYDAQNCPIEGISFYINEPTPVTVTLNGGATICSGEEVQIAANGYGGTSPYTYEWSHPSITNNDQIQFVSPESTTSYYVSAVDANGCLSSGYDSVTINVYPNINLAMDLSDSVICNGENSTVSAFASGGNGGPYIYYWEDMGVTSPSINVSPSTPTWYTVTVSDGCSPNVVDSLLIVVNPIPTIDIRPSILSGCEPIEVSFENYNDLIGTNYEWDFGDISGDINTSNEQFPTHIYESSGSFDVSLTVSSADGCTNESTVSDLIRVYPIPDADFTWSPETASSFRANIQFSDLSTNAAFWHWYFYESGDMFETNEQNPQVTFSYADTFDIHLEVWSEHGCYDSISHQIVITPEHTFYAPTAFTPVAAHEISNSENVYCTPEATGVAECNDCYDLVVFDRWGEIIFETNGFYGNTHDENDRWNGRVQNQGKIVQIGVY
ncbi:MAG: hypothetical protein C0594_12055, partial [Marinilabiliales bacterium]